MTKGNFFTPQTKKVFNKNFLNGNKWKLTQKISFVHYYRRPNFGGMYISVTPKTDFEKIKSIMP